MLLSWNNLVLIISPNNISPNFTSKNIRNAESSIVARIHKRCVLEGRGKKRIHSLWEPLNLMQLIQKGTTVLSRRLNIQE